MIYYKSAVVYDVIEDQKHYYSDPIYGKFD